jgi:hypothetical protein
MFQKMFRPIVEKLVREAMLKISLAALLTMKPDNQYLFFVPNDEIGKEISDAIQGTLDLSKGPRILVIVSKDIRLLEIVK